MEAKAVVWRSPPLFESFSACCLERSQCESQTSPTQPVIELESYILVKMNSTKVPMLEGLEQGILPLVLVVPLE
jgi:hypothetical protein